MPVHCSTIRIGEMFDNEDYQLNSGDSTASWQSRTVKPFRKLAAIASNAIKLTKDLGERCLWVDCLCTLQVIPRDQLVLITRMNLVYRAASLTGCLQIAPFS